MNFRQISRRLTTVFTTIGLLGIMAVTHTAFAAEPTITQQATHQYDAGEYTRDYKFDTYLTSDVTDYDDYRQWVSNNVADRLPVIGGFGGLCTYMLKQGGDGHWLVGRNLDTSVVMPSIRVRTHPSGGYASIGNAFVMKASHTDEPTSTELKASALAAPYFTADGVNEKGVSTALLALNHFNAPTDSSKHTINQFSLVRLVLDHAASVDEAEQLIRRFNVADFTASGKPSTYGLHLAVADKTGDLAVFEWQGGQLHVTHPQAGSQIVVNTATWSGASAKDSRFIKAKRYLSQMSGDDANEGNLLKVLHQLPSSAPIQWSVVYDLTDMSGIQTSRENANNVFSATQSFAYDSSFPPTPSAPATTATASFNPNGGSGTVAPITFNPGDTITAPAGTGLTRDGWKFDGWNTKADGTGIKVKAGQSLPTKSSTKSFVLYAQWTRDGGNTGGSVSTKTVTLRVDANGGTLEMSSASIQVRAGGSVNLSTLFASREGWVLSGWNTKADGTGDAYPVDGCVTFSADSTLHAQWIDLSQTTDISKAGKLTISGVLNSDGSSAGGTDGGGVSHEGRLKDTVGQLASVSVVMTGTLDNPGGLRKGQLIHIPWGMKSGSHYSVGMVSCPNVIDDGDGNNDMTVVACRTDGMVARVDDGLKGMSRYRFSVTVSQSWVQSPESIKVKTATASTLEAADDHWTVFNSALTAKSFPNRIDAIQQINGIGFAATRSLVRIGSWAAQEMSGTSAGADADKDMVVVQHVTPAFGSAITGVTPIIRRDLVPYVTANGISDWTSSAAWNVGLEQVDAAATAISTPALASRTLHKGQWAAARADDGSWYVAVDFGPARNGDTIPDGVSTDDDTTNKAIDALRKRGMFGVDASFVFAVNFAGDGISHATVTYDSSTGFPRLNPSPYQITTASASSSAEGARVGSVAYDGNGGEGDMPTQIGMLGDKVSASDNGYKRSGWTFTGWNTKADGTGDDVRPGDQVALANPGTILYAQWKAAFIEALPGTGGRASLVPVVAGMGLAVSIAAAWFIRRRLD